ncbi:MAG: methyltransferase domain-containing protein [Cyanobacteria bacterium P01_E01_bin.42]
MSNSSLHTTTSEKEASRYSRRNILLSERMYGTGFSSSGGIESIEFFCQDVPLSQGISVLDIGCGSGGMAFYFAEKYKAEVLGMDYAADNVALCQDRLRDKSHLAIAFEQGDIQTAALERDRFDLIWCRDVFIYLEDKGKGWGNIYQALKPGGYFVYSDFCKGDGNISPEFQGHLAICNYHAWTIAQSCNLMQEIGFNIVSSKNLSTWLAENFQADLQKLAQNRETFLQEFTEEEYQHLASRWQAKIQYCQQDDLVQGLIVAKK